MATTTRATVRRPNWFGLRMATVLAVLALIGLGASPAAALTRTGVTPLSGGPIVVSDPCVPGPQIVSFTATPTEIEFGENATLSWNVQVPGGCRYAIMVAGQPAALQGSLVVTPDLGAIRTSGTSATYRLVVAYGNNLDRLVSDPRDTVDIAVDVPASKTFRFTTSWVTMFIRALNTPDATVLLNSSIDMDLSPVSQTIPIAAGVKLVGARTAVPGKPYDAGPRLFTTSFFSQPETSISNALFAIQGDNVRITGIRLEGPHLDVPNKGIFSGSNLNIEIDHNEIYGWNAVGVDLADKWGRITVPVLASDASRGIVYPSQSEPAWVHDNYIHDNYYGQTGEGYGVAVGTGARALIERNVFDAHRHGIAADHDVRTGYRAYRNLFLTRGYEDEQPVDVHGDRHCPTFPTPVLLLAPWLGLFQGGGDMCGQAGHDFDIRNNSFAYVDGPSIRVRGTPQLAPSGVVISANVFANPSLFSAQDGFQPAVESSADTGVLVTDDNAAGVTWSWQTTCDFNGDGINDTFITTGQTWWYSSGGTGPWIYLNASTLTVERGEVTLGDFDGDNICDVMAGGIIYSGGATPLRAPRPIPGRARSILGQ